MYMGNMRRGIVPGMIAGFVFLAYVGAGAGPAGLTEDGAITNALSNGMIDLVGGMIGAGDLVGFILHILISAVIGALYTGLFADRLDFGNSFMSIVIGGLAYGLIWWIIGGNIFMPLIAGGDVLQLSIGPSFFGHIMFGHVLAFLVVLRDRAFGMDDFDDRAYAKPPRQEHPAGYVYEIYDKATGLSKIGRTIDPERRMREHRRDYGKQLEYKSLMKSDNAPEEESRLHKKHSSRRKDGEWFDMN